MTSAGRPRLHLFDLDGTLMAGSAAREISRQLGLEKEIEELECSFAAGGLTPPAFAERACRLWSGLTEEQVGAAFAGAPWIGGIREVWEGIRESGDRCAVISLSPEFFVRRLAEEVPGSGGACRPGADAARGSLWPDLPFADPVDPAGILLPETKVRVAAGMCAAFGMSLNDCVAYGDSRSDVPLFGAVPVSVAVNADHHVSSLASFRYDGSDLRGAWEVACYGR